MANYDTDSNHVKAVQHAVNAAGYSPQLVEDGVYGPATKAGVVWFQGQHGLTADGIIGDATMAAIGPTPPGGDPLAGLRASVAALAATQAAAGQPVDTSVVPPNILALAQLVAPAAAPAPVVQKTIKLTLRAPSASAGSAAAAPVAMSAPVMPAPIVAAPPASPVLPTIAGAVLGGGAGAALSSVLALPLIALAAGGGALGALLGFGINKLMHPTSTMHGEADFGIDFGCDDTDQLTIMAGEIGVPAPVQSLLY